MQKRKVAEIVKNIYGNMPDPFEPTLLVKESPRKYNYTTGRQTFRKNINKKNGS